MPAIRPTIGGRISQVFSYNEGYQRTPFIFIASLFHMRKSTDICYCYCTWQNWQLEQSCQHIFHWFDYKSYKFYIYFGFLAPWPARCNFQHIDQKVQLLAIKSILTKVEIFGLSKCPNHAHVLTLSVHFTMGQFGGII